MPSNEQGRCRLRALLAGPGNCDWSPSHVGGMERMSPTAEATGRGVWRGSVEELGNATTVNTHGAIAPEP